VLELVLLKNVEDDEELVFRFSVLELKLSLLKLVELVVKSKNVEELDSVEPEELELEVISFNVLDDDVLRLDNVDSLVVLEEMVLELVVKSLKVEEEVENELGDELEEVKLTSVDEVELDSLELLEDVVKSKNVEDELKDVVLSLVLEDVDKDVEEETEVLDKLVLELVSKASVELDELDVELDVVKLKKVDEEVKEVLELDDELVTDTAVELLLLVESDEFETLLDCVIDKVDEVESVDNDDEVDKELLLVLNNAVDSELVESEDEDEEVVKLKNVELELNTLNVLALVLLCVEELELNVDSELTDVELLVSNNTVLSDDEELVVKSLNVELEDDDALLFEDELVTDCSVELDELLDNGTSDDELEVLLANVDEELDNEELDEDELVSDIAVELVELDELSLVLELVLLKNVEEELKLVLELLLDSVVSDTLLNEDDDDVTDCSVLDVEEDSEVVELVSDDDSEERLLDDEGDELSELVDKSAVDELESLLEELSLVDTSLLEDDVVNSSLESDDSDDEKDEHCAVVNCFGSRYCVNIIRSPSCISVHGRK